MPSSTPEFVEPQQPEIDFFSPSSVCIFDYVFDVECI